MIREVGDADGVKRGETVPNTPKTSGAVNIGVLKRRVSVFKSNFSLDIMIG